MNQPTIGEAYLCYYKGVAKILKCLETVHASRGWGWYDGAHSFIDPDSWERIPNAGEVAELEEIVVVLVRRDLRESKEIEEAGT